MSLPFGRLPDHADAEFIGCLMTCLASSDPDVKLFWMCYPGGWFYRFQYYHPEDGPILRYDNAHDDDTLGWHHRHVRFGEDTEIPFHNVVSHIARFLQEIVYLTKGDQENHD